MTRAASSLPRLLLAVALAALGLGLVAWAGGEAARAELVWAAGIVPVLAWLAASTLRGLLERRTGVDLIAALAMAGALLLGETLAGIVVAVMVTGGNVLEELAESRASRALTALLGRVPRTAHRLADGRLETVAAAAVAVGDELVVRQGELVPVDGVLLDPSAALDEAALTGESRAVARSRGEPLRSGALNAGPPLRMRATAPAAASTYAGIVRLVEAARAQKAPLVRLADRWALLFLPATLLMAGLAWLASGDPVRALAVLVVATPCPLILAAPVAIVSGMSAAARRGVLFKGGGALETLARVRTLIADKTGTLTTGIARLTAIEPAPGHEAEAVLRAAASLDQLSDHVIAASIVRAAAARGLALAMPGEVVEAPGAGISGQVDGHAVRLGTLDYAAEGAAPSAWAERVLRRARVDEAAAVFVAIDGGLAGALLLADEIRTETPRALRRLRAVGIARIVLLSGDRAEVAEAVASALGVDALLAERSPADKLDAVRAEKALAVTAMVGDGINDAPALAAADVGVALGVRGAAAASEAADVVLLVDELDRLAEAVAIARGARGIALQSILVGMGLSGCAMIVAAFGHLPPVAGALLQEAIDVAVILNALRALRTGGGTRRGRLPADEIARLEADHRLLRPLLDRVRATADRLQDGALAVPPAELRALARSLDKQILAHERADETSLHPRVASLLGGDDPMAAISRTHREIAHLVRRFAQLAAALPAQQPPAAEELRELRSILYALDAILRLHFAQEEEIYASVAADAGRPRAATG